jgi:hypothetical protein
LATVWILQHGIDEIEYIVDNYDMARDIGKIENHIVTKVNATRFSLRKIKTNEIEVGLHERMDIENRLTNK